jgi:hypothetical protein
MGVIMEFIDKAKKVFKKGYREVTDNERKNFSVSTMRGNSWYLHCLCDMVNAHALSETEYNNFIQSDLAG